MVRKKLSEMTLKEYCALPKRTELCKEILRTLRREEFTEKQLMEMNAEKVWKLFLDGFGAQFNQKLTANYDLLIALKALEKEIPPQFKPIINRNLKKLSEKLNQIIAELKINNKNI